MRHAISTCARPADAPSGKASASPPSRLVGEMKHSARGAATRSPTRTAAASDSSAPRALRTASVLVPPSLGVPMTARSGRSCPSSDETFSPNGVECGPCHSSTLALSGAPASAPSDTCSRSTAAWWYDQVRRLPPGTAIDESATAPALEGGAVCCGRLQLP